MGRSYRKFSFCKAYYNQYKHQPQTNLSSLLDRWRESSPSSRYGFTKWTERSLKHCEKQNRNKKGPWYVNKVRIHDTNHRKLQYYYPHKAFQTFCKRNQRSIIWRKASSKSLNREIETIYNNLSWVFGTSLTATERLKTILLTSANCCIW